MAPLVSFVVPCYKLAHLLPECVNSILAQSFHDFEILIMDNCSPDNTPEVAASFRDGRVRHVRNETNIGHVRNFNKGIEMARGKYVWLVSADDWLRSPEILGRYVELMEQNPRVGYVFCSGVEVRGSKEIGIGQWTNCGPEDQIWEVSSFLPRLAQKYCVHLSAAMVRKECYEKFGLFSLEMPHANDAYLFFTLAIYYQVAYISEPMVSVRIHEESLTNALYQKRSPLCIIDEMTARWRAARLAELAGVISNRSFFNSDIATIAAQGVRYGTPGRGSRPGLSENDLEAVIHQHVRDPQDEKDFRARLQMAIGDEEFWHGHYKKAAQAYYRGLRLRPWWIRIWVKYLLLWTGGVGIRVRRIILDQRESHADAA